MTERTSSDTDLGPDPTVDDATVDAGDRPDHGRRNTRVIWLLLAATFVVILNETIMGVALPKLMTDLRIDAGTAQWLSTAFMLTMAVVIPITGYLLERFDTRPIFIAAMSLFSLGTLIAALAPGFEILLLGRIVQASGTAIMVPLLMTTLMTLVAPAERGKTMGNVSIVISVAPAIGPTISGFILDTLSWRWMFWIVLPIAVAMLVIGIRHVENVTEPQKVPIDVLSVVLSAFGFGGLVYGLSRVGEAVGTGPGAPSAGIQMWIALGVGAVALASFIVRQLLLQRRDVALLDLRTFNSPIFTVAVSMMAVSMMALFGTIILLPIYLQNVLHMDPVRVGLLLLPGGLIMGLLAPFVGRIYDKRGPRVLLIPGSIIVSTVLWSLTLVNATTSPFFMLAAHIVLSLGLALMFTPLFSAGLGAVQPQLYSHGSAIVGTVQQVAGAAGTALFITIMTAQTGVLTVSGASPEVALADGVRMAFLAGAIISLLAIIGAVFIRKPSDAPGGSHGGH
ncbi:DHA2 family efflux MFS transporter permease subunit [Luethyella okanaganae]|uniref:DHA2 family efflux MFS transporter permease subunit n=1 Tax=Luethyella okanaganae TaxID=69372 RepID=A0ABW1VBW3_9MICO